MKIQKLILFGLLFSATPIFSQIKEEKLILDRKREPEVRKIEKKKTSVETIKNYPPEEKSQTLVNYDIINVPAVSDFKTSTIQGEDISPKFNSEIQKNYVRFGMGNYGKILGDANISTILESKMEVGADVHYLSTTGLKKDYDWDSKATNATVGAFLNNYSEKGKLNLNAEYELNDYNYYGIYALKPASDIDLQQKTNQFRVNGFYDFYENNILDDARVKTNFLKDHFDANESYGALELNLAKHEVEIPKFEGISMNADLGLEMETLNTEFSLLDKNASNFFNISAKPKLTFFKDKSYLMIGSEVAYLNEKTSSLKREEESTGKTLWYPMAEVLFAATDEFKFYAGIDGGHQLNSYADLLKTNPYLVSDQELRPTETKYHFYFGIKGDIDQNLKYDLSAGFGKVKDAVFFQHNDLFDNTYSLQRSAYNFANTFSAVYDDGKVSDVKASLHYFPLQNLALEAQVSYFNYNLDYLDNVYGTNGIKGELGAKYSMLNQKLLLGFKGFFGTGNTVKIFDIQPTETSPLSYISTLKEQKVGGYADFNLSAEYKVHKNFSIFALGNNLLNNKYQKFYGYKVLGAQILGGVKISF